MEASWARGQAGRPGQGHTRATNSGADPSAAANQRETRQMKVVFRGKAAASRKEEREEDVPVHGERSRMR